MTLDLGELVGYLEIDRVRWDRGIDEALRSVDDFGDRAKGKGKVAGDKTGDAFSDAVVPAAERAGEEAGDKAGDGMKAKGVIAASAAGAAFGFAFTQALDVGAGRDKLVAQLGANKVQAKRYGEAAGNLYAQAWGDSLDQVNDSVANVVRNIGGMRVAARSDLEDITSGVLDVVTAFDQDLGMTTAAVGQMMRTGLAKDARDALDIITVGLQGPANKADDLLETFNEYGTQFRNVGIDGRDAILLLGQGLQGGARDADIVADALKEFTLRSVGDLTKTLQTKDGPVASLTELGEAFRNAGYDALDNDPKLAKMAWTLQEDIAGGGKKARDALQIFLDSLRDTDDPLERSRTAVALFGTQAEDMGDSLLSLDLEPATKQIGKVEGASRKMSDQLNGNARTSLTEFKRTIQTDLVGYLEDKVIPVVEDDVIPAIKRFSDWFEQDGGPAAADFVDDLKPVVKSVGDLVGFLNDMPGEAKLMALGGAIGGGLVIKHKLAGVFDRGGIGNPMFVVVTNPGTGGGPGGVVPGAGGKPGVPGAPVLAGGSGLLNKFIRFGGPGALIGLGGAGDLQGDVVDHNGNPAQVAGADRTKAFLANAGLDEASGQIDGLIAKVDQFKGSLDLVGSTKVHPDLAVPGLREASQGLSDFIDQQIVAGRPVYPAIFLTGVERAMGQIATLNAGIDSLGERGLDNGVPYLHGGTQSSGRGGKHPAANGRRSPFDGALINVQPHDYQDFMHEMQQRTQSAGLGGVGDL